MMQREVAGSPELELSVVLPCLDEAETIATCVRKARQFLEAHGIRGEVVVGDNGSTDGSQALAREAGARVVDVPVRGYGAAVHHATLASAGRFVIMADSDDSYDLSALTPFLDKLREGYELVMGDRFRGGIAAGAMPWKNRYLGNPVLSGIGRIFFGTRIRDFHCGIRGYSRAAFERMSLQTTGMEFASEMVIKAALLGMRVAEVPTTLARDGRSRPPHLRPWRDGWRHLRFMLLYSPAWLFRYPGLVLVALGLAVMAWLLPGPRRVGDVVLDVHTLLYAAVAVSVGLQAIAFSRFAIAYCAAQGLLPATEERPHRYALERSLLLGVALVVAGLVGSAVALAGWGRQHFGPLDSTWTLRLVIPSVLAMVAGAQVTLASFLLGVLQLGVRRAAPPTSGRAGTGGVP